MLLGSEFASSEHGMESTYATKEKRFAGQVILSNRSLLLEGLRDSFSSFENQSKSSSGGLIIAAPMYSKLILFPSGSINIFNVFVASISLSSSLTYSNTYYYHIVSLTRTSYFCVFQ